MTAYQLWSMGDELEIDLFAYRFTVTLSYHAIKTACSPQGDFGGRSTLTFLKEDHSFFKNTFIQ